MDPIRPGQPVNRPDQTQPPKDAKRVGAEGQVFDVNAGAPAAGGAEAAGLPQPIFDRLQSQIKEAASRTNDREVILREIVTTELRSSFGEHASDEMIAASTERILADPGLSALYHGLLRSAGVEPTGD